MLKIKYVDKLPNDFAGKFYGIPFFPVIKILKKYKNDIGLLVHEKTHYEQYKKTFGLFELLYLFKHFRLKWEVEAYTNQILYEHKVNGRDLDTLITTFAEYLSTKYKLNISYKDAVIELYKSIRERV